MKFIEALLEFLFPPSFSIHDKSHLPGDDLEVWLRYEVPNHTEHDPFRPLGYRDSWAGKTTEKSRFACKKGGDVQASCDQYAREEQASGTAPKTGVRPDPARMG